MTKILYSIVLFLGIASLLLALWARRQGSRRWKYRLLNSLIVIVGALYLLWSGQ